VTQEKVRRLEPTKRGKSDHRGTRGKATQGGLQLKEPLLIDQRTDKVSLEKKVTGRVDGPDGKSTPCRAPRPLNLPVNQPSAISSGHCIKKEGMQRGKKEVAYRVQNLQQAGSMTYFNKKVLTGT